VELLQMIHQAKLDTVGGEFGQEWLDISPTHSTFQFLLRAVLKVVNLHITQSDADVQVHPNTETA
jgi:hypothetical protein